MKFDQSDAKIEKAASPSARRARIEIRGQLRRDGGRERSPSARRVWIEMSTGTRAPTPAAVALLAEGVD